MRMLDNCSLEPEKVKDIQDDLNYYIECNQVCLALRSGEELSVTCALVGAGARLC